MKSDWIDYLHILKLSTFHCYYFTFSLKINPIRFHYMKAYRKIEEPENRDAFLYVKFVSKYVNNCIQIHVTLSNLIKPNLT